MRGQAGVRQDILFYYSDVCLAVALSAFLANFLTDISISSPLCALVTLRLHCFCSHLKLPRKHQQPRQRASSFLWDDFDIFIVSFSIVFSKLRRIFLRHPVQRKFPHFSCTCDYFTKTKPGKITLISAKCTEFHSDSSRLDGLFTSEFQFHSFWFFQRETKRRLSFQSKWVTVIILYDQNELLRLLAWYGLLL